MDYLLGQIVVKHNLSPDDLNTLKKLNRLMNLIAIYTVRIGLSDPNNKYRWEEKLEKTRGKFYILAENLSEDVSRAFRDFLKESESILLDEL